MGKRKTELQGEGQEERIRTTKQVGPNFLETT